jgi:hypothetical protein
MVSPTEMKQNISAFDQRLNSAKTFITENRSRLCALEPSKTRPEQRLGGKLIALMHLPISPDASFYAFRRKLLAQVHPDKFRAVNDESILMKARTTLDKTESFLQEFHVETIWNHVINLSMEPIKPVELSEHDAKVRSVDFFNQLANRVKTDPLFTSSSVCDFMNDIKVAAQPPGVQSKLFCLLMDTLRSGKTDRIRGVCAEAATILLCIPHFMLTRSMQTTYKPLLLALKLGLTDLTEALLQRDETLTNLQDEDLNTALHLAILHDDTTLVRSILEKPGTNLSLKNVYGDSPLDTAREIGNHTITWEILKRVYKGIGIV